MIFKEHMDRFILYNLLNQIILHDLIEENNAGIFDYKREWQKRWQQDILTFINDTGGNKDFFLDWERLKGFAVEWMKQCRDSREKELILEECFKFSPYTALPGWKTASSQKAAVNPDARSLALRKACTLMGFDDMYFEDHLENERIIK